MTVDPVVYLSLVLLSSPSKVVQKKNTPVYFSQTKVNCSSEEEYSCLQTKVNYYLSFWLVTF